MHQLLTSTCLSMALAAPFAVGAADIRVINNDQPGVGFNNSQERECGELNPGQTLGECRLNAFRYAAELIASKIESDITIRVRARFAAPEGSDPLACDRGSATTGAAGPLNLFAFNERDRPNDNFRPNTFYPVALANALAGRDLAPPPDNENDPPGADIGAEFNGRIDDNPECLAGMNWYYGFDGDPPGFGSSEDIDAVATIAHELVHGLGFLTGVSLNTGEFRQDLPFIYDTLIRDLDREQLWPDLTTDQRQNSTTNNGQVVWDGAQTTREGAPTLEAGSNEGHVRLYAPSSDQENDAPVQGSSISHWDTAVQPNALMEPQDTGDINVNNGIGLAACLLADIGWTLASGVNCPDRQRTDPVEFAAAINFDTSSSNDDNGGDDGGGGGGCTLSSQSNRIAPLLPLLIAAGLLGIRRRRSA